jgi:hypothetical protein
LYGQKDFESDPVLRSSEMTRWVILDRVIEISLRVDARFDSESHRDCAALQYVAMGQNRTHAAAERTLFMTLSARAISAAKSTDQVA